MKLKTIVFLAILLLRPPLEPSNLMPKETAAMLGKGFRRAKHLDDEGGGNGAGR